MAQRIWVFLVVLLLIFQGAILGQETNTLNGAKSPICEQIIEKSACEFVLTGYHPEKIFTFSKFFIHTRQFKIVPAVDPVIIKRPQNPDQPILPASFYTKQIGFFCQKELQLDKMTFIPFRFRLGSLDYVNWMEKKNVGISNR